MVVDHVSIGHTNTGILDGEELVLLIGDNTDVKLLLGLEGTVRNLNSPTIPMPYLLFQTSLVHNSLEARETRSDNSISKTIMFAYGEHLRRSWGC